MLSLVVCLEQDNAWCPFLSNHATESLFLSDMKMRNCSLTVHPCTSQTPPHSELPLWSNLAAVVPLCQPSSGSHSPVWV